MQFEILLNSRTYNVDYRWIACPSYLSGTLRAQVLDLMYLLERSGNPAGEDYLRNIFFLADESGGVLVRGGYSAGTDKFGRQIYSVEGIACPAGQLRVFWYALPALIAWMTLCPLFRDTWVYGMAEETDLTGMKVEIAELSAGERDDTLYESGFFGNCSLQVQECLQFLQEDVLAAEELFSFAFIPDDSRLYLENLPVSGDQGIRRVYTKRSIREMPAFSPVSFVPFGEVCLPDEGYRIEVRIWEGKEASSLSLRAVDERGREIACLDQDLTFEAAGMALSGLESAAQQLRDEIRFYGYRREV